MKDKTDIDYYPEVDPFEEMDLEGLIDEENYDIPEDFGEEVLPEEEKQIPEEEKQIPEDSPPEYTPGDIWKKYKEKL